VFVSVSLPWRSQSTCNLSATFRHELIPGRPLYQHPISTPYIYVHNAAASRRITSEVKDGFLSVCAPSVYVLSAAALSKPGAVQHLAADLHNYGVSVAVITETHYKLKHTDNIFGIDGFTVYRRDWVGRRGGGVAVYVTTAMRSSRSTPAVATVDATLEVDWVRVGDHTFIAGVRRSLSFAKADLQTGSATRVH